jgi:hypothetical protein
VSLPAEGPESAVVLQQRATLPVTGGPDHAPDDERVVVQPESSIDREREAREDVFELWQAVGIAAPLDGGAEFVGVRVGECFGDAFLMVGDQVDEHV